MRISSDRQLTNIVKAWLCVKPKKPISLIAYTQTDLIVRRRYPCAIDDVIQFAVAAASSTEDNRFR